MSREQGVNGRGEMAAAFTRVGFDAIDVHMTAVVAGRPPLTAMVGLAACGGFSYGDALGAGRGWAGTIRHSVQARAVFDTFFARRDCCTLGVRNGCQRLAKLMDPILGAAYWPTLLRNRAEQIKARLVMAEVLASPSILMPHPERVFLSRQFAWLSSTWRDAESPWLALFNNARRFVDGEAYARSSRAGGVNRREILWRHIARWRTAFEAIVHNGACASTAKY